MSRESFPGIPREEACASKEQAPQLFHGIAARFLAGASVPWLATPKATEQADRGNFDFFSGGLRRDAVSPSDQRDRRAALLDQVRRH